MYKYKVSVVMAVYNVEPFLREAIDSVIAQNMGFENIQLILVDDGSPDGSGAICDEYAAKYPNNIVVIHKENGGVSSARNAGLDIAEGELINFLDSDDMITPAAFQNAWSFYQANKAKTDVVVLPMHFFEGKTGEHTLNYKFKKGSRVIDLDSEWNVCQLQVGATFISSQRLKNIRFDERLSYAEDAHLLQRVLAGKCTMGVIQNRGAYMYRQRAIGEESALQSSTTKKNWYLDYFKYFQENTIQYYLDLYGRVPRFVQFVLMYDIQWRLRMEKIREGVLTAEEEEEFYGHLFGMLKHIEDDVILAQRNLFSEFKVFALKMKYGSQTLQERDNDIALVFGNTVAAKLSNCSCRLEFLDITPEEFTLEGRISVFDGLQDNITIYLRVNDDMYPAQLQQPEVFKVSLGNPILHMCAFRASVPLNKYGNSAQISIWIEKSGKLIQMNQRSFGTFFPLNSRKYKSAYAYQNGWKVTFSLGIFTLAKSTPSEIIKCELRFLKELWKSNKTGERKAVFARLLLPLLRRMKRKPMWLVRARTAKAGDIGEAFFLYLRQHHPEIDARFVIGKDSPDYERMKKAGPVLAKDSFVHKMYSLICDYIISSQGESDVFNPFIGYSEPYRSYLAQQKFIFLQHGITQNDLSSWLDRYNKNILGFVTAIKAEQQSILDYPYHYTPEKVWLTGFPRFDRLYCAEERQITIIPTWRKYLLGVCSRDTKSWTLGNSFMQSEYLTFYNGLINHPRLLKAAKQLNYRIAFLPHPNLQDHIDVFQHNDQVVFLGRDAEYRDVYAKSNLVLTDYSSAVFDFAYLRKPVVYAQFDREMFFSGAHTTRPGYFDYERDGFGEVTKDLEETVDVLIDYMENDCRMKEEYNRKVDAFFTFNDRNNCQRVFERIMELDQK